MIVVEKHWKLLEDRFKAFCDENGLDPIKAKDLMHIALVTDFQEEISGKQAIAPEILSVRQSYKGKDKPDVVFSIGDKTTDGKILKINENGGYWYAITDKPSEWHLQNGQDHGWNWLWMLEKVAEEADGLNPKWVIRKGKLYYVGGDPSLRNSWSKRLSDAKDYLSRALAEQAEILGYIKGEVVKR